MGVTIETITPGNGEDFPRPNDVVTIDYVGTLENGKIFDSTKERGTPFTTDIGVGKVIKGWDEAIPKLSLNQKAKLTISPDYAYGHRGFPPVIPPQSTLIFEVELLKIEPPKKK